MTSKTIHINTEKDKKYIIPTNDWLIPIKPLITNDINTRSLIMLSKLVDKGEVVVKITKNSNFEQIKLINNLVKNNPNMLHTFGTLQCDENEINYDTSYTDSKGYCNSNQSQTENIKITLEIMRLYSNSLTKYIKKLNMLDIKQYFKQLIYAQLHIFDKIGFIHNDIHLGNILIKKKSEDEELNYIILGKKYNISTNRILIIMDYDRSIIYDQSLMKLPEPNLDFTIMYNIVKTIKEISKLLIDGDRKLLIDIFEESSITFHYPIIEYSEKILRGYYKKQRDYNDFKELSIKDCIQLCNVIWDKLYDESLFPSYKL